MNPEGPQTPKIVDLAQVREERALREQPHVPYVLLEDEMVDARNLPESPAEPLSPEELALLFPPKAP